MTKKESDDLRAVKNLLEALKKGEVSANEKGWVSLKEAKRMLGL